MTSWLKIYSKKMTVRFQQGNQSKQNISEQAQFKSEQPYSCQIATKTLTA